MSGRRSSTDKTPSAERGRRQRRKSGRSYSPELQTPPRMASFSVGCRSRVNGQTGWTATAAFAEVRLQRRAKSLSLPPSEHPVLAADGPNAHVASTSQYSHVRLAVKGRERHQRNEGRHGGSTTKERRGSWHEAAALDHLAEGDIFADRFRIDRAPIDGKLHGCYATELSTRQSVFLKFYPSSHFQWQNAIRMHRALRDNRHVCKLLETLPGKDGFPPCLVLEAGAFTLEQRLGGHRPTPVEQRALVHSVMEAVAELHAQRVVHGNLDPSHMMWFATDVAWKVINLDTASTIGDEVLLAHVTSRRYIAPEIRRALVQQSKKIRLERASDMWAVGLMAFEVFVGASVEEAAGVKRYVGRELDRMTKHGHSRHVDPRDGRKAPEQVVHELQSIAALLKDDPTKRTTAARALGAAEMREALLQDIDDPVDVLRKFSDGGGSPEDGEEPLEKWWIGHLMRQHLSISLSAERFASDSDPTVEFYSRDMRKTRHFMDDALPNSAVYVMTTGEQFRLRISIQSNKSWRLPFGEIRSVDSFLPDGECVSLTFCQRQEAHGQTVLALVDPSTFRSSRIKTVSPSSGLVDTRYVRLTVRMKLRLGDGYPDDFLLVQAIYLQFKRPSTKLRFFRGISKSKENVIEQ